jgi:hypothetical protein
MDGAAQGMAIIAALSVALERVLELIRWLMDQPVAKPVRSLLDGLTAGRGAVIPALAMAILTNADLVYAFKMKHGELEFFAHYLDGLPQGREVVGCVLMGLALTLGSQFWHDLVKGLTDVRQKVKAVTPLDSVELLAPPRVQPARPLVVAAT